MDRGGYLYLLGCDSVFLNTEKLKSGMHDDDDDDDQFRPFLVLMLKNSL